MNLAPHATAAATQPVVMKFGGTSVADAPGIARVAGLIAASLPAALVVVVSAMSGATDALLAAAEHAAARRRRRARRILAALDRRHRRVAAALLPQAARADYCRQIDAILSDAHRVLAAEFSPEDREFLAGIGERLTAPLLAATLVARGIRSQALAATELILTDRVRTQEPDLAATRDCARARLLPLLAAGILPVVTGFIASTPGGVATTLGRGGSDVSATILAAALAAREVVIWTDVDGLYPADPRLHPQALPFSEISYREAADLAARGAKVLHPRTLAPLQAAAIPVWIRNTFAPHRAGTKITPTAPAHAPAAPLGSSSSALV